MESTEISISKGNNKENDEYGYNRKKFNPQRKLCCFLKVDTNRDSHIKILSQLQKVKYHICGS